MELVQNIARLGSETGESGETITRAKYCTGKPSCFIPPQNYLALFIERDFILPFSSGRILSYFILPHPTLSHFILLFRSRHDFPWGMAFELSAVRQGAPARGTVCAAD